MLIKATATLDYEFDEPTDILLQIEAAIIPEQLIESAFIDVGYVDHFTRIPAHDNIGERIWIRKHGRLQINYNSTVRVMRILGDVAQMEAVPLHMLPGETVQYLFDSIYCPATKFQHFVQVEFGHLSGGARIAAMRDWVRDKFVYSYGVSDSRTTALDSFVMRMGVCRDYAHVLITMARASSIPARIASVYALGVEPQDFHAVCEVFLQGEWHMVDATGMARAADMIKIGVGRDAADISFLTAYGNTRLNYQFVTVEPA